MRRMLIVVLLSLLSTAVGAAYPEKPIRFVVPSAAGGSVDVLMRILTTQLSTQMKVPFVIENKPGASFVLGTMDIVKAPPDGGTPEEFMALVKRETPKWAEVIRRSGAKVD